MTKPLLQKFHDGIALTDAECKELYKFFTELEYSLTLMGEEYKLARLPVMFDKMAVEGYLMAREIKI